MIALRRSGESLATPPSDEEEEEEEESGSEDGDEEGAGVEVDAERARARGAVEARVKRSAGRTRDMAA